MVALEHTAPAPRWDVVQESFREAEFLWGRWEDALDSPCHTLDDVQRWVEERLLGALDGLTLGGARAIHDILVPALSARRVRGATVAALALSSMGAPGTEALADALCTLPEARVPALGRGIQRGLDEQAPRHWVKRLSSLPPHAQAVVLEAWAFRQWRTPDGIDRVLARNEKSVQQSCLKLAATQGTAWSRTYVEWGLARSSVTLRLEAARSGLLLGMPRALEVAHELVAGNVPGGESLLPAVALARGERALPLMTARLRAGTATREVFEALACVGTLEAGELCAHALDHEPHTRLAAEALATILGITPRPRRDREAEDDAHARTEAPRLGPDLLLPDPDIDDLRARWLALRSDLKPHCRYLDGRPFVPEGLRDALTTLPTRRRHALATDLALRTAGKSHVTTRTWTGVQRAQIAAAVLGS